MRKALVGGAYPGMGTGDPDLYKAFCWRFWKLTCEGGGRIGVVLPRSALAAKGSTDFRKTIFDDAERVDVTMLVNNRQWVFPEVHPQYSIGLVCVKHGTPKKNRSTCGSLRDAVQFRCWCGQGAGCVLQRVGDLLPSCMPSWNTRRPIAIHRCHLQGSFTTCTSNTYIGQVLRYLQK